jgi:geranylgeranyl diphosphate synthase type I
MLDDRTDRAAFDAHLGRTKSIVDRALAGFLEEEQVVASALRPDLGFVAGLVKDLAIRGGKRFRAALSSAAFLGFGGKDWEQCIPGLVALELLQVYLLIHDDWMDGDETRRGGKSVPAALRERYGAGNFADSSAILAGDHAAALALQALSGVSAQHASRAMLCFGQMQRDVVFGQMLDIAPVDAWGTRSWQDLSPIETVYRLKTGSYTVRGPLALGAILAGASAERVKALSTFSDSLGVAFQLTDDLLSTFESEETTGKPAYGDLREGKLTWLMMRAIDDPKVKDAMPGAWKTKDASFDKLQRLARAIEESGAKSAVVERAAKLSAEARAALPGLGLTSEMQNVLSGAISALTERAS